MRIADLFMLAQPARWLVWLAAASVLHSAGGAEPINWLNSAEARRELEGAVRLTWPSNPLRDSLENLSRNRRLAIWLDRRIDPDQRVEFKTEDMRLSEALRQLAAQLDCGVCLIGPVVYIGPRETAAQLNALSARRREEAGKLAPETRGKLARSRPWQWEKLAEPRQLIEQLAEESGVAILHAELAPHDLWPAGDLPAMTVVDRLSLVLAGFDLTFEYAPDGSSVRLVPFPASAPVERTYTIKGDVGQVAEQIAKLFPQARLSTAAGKITVTASAADQAEIARLAAGDQPKRPPVAGGKTVYTLKIENQPVGAAAKALARQMDLELKFQADLSEVKLAERVSLQVKDASFDELFDALLAPAGLTHSLSGKTLVISARK